MHKGEIETLIKELRRMRVRFLYHKAIVGYTKDNWNDIDSYRYSSGNYYETNAVVKIEKNGVSPYDHNESSHDVNRYFIISCAVIIQDFLEDMWRKKIIKDDIFCKKYKKIRTKNKKPLCDFSYCQLFYILRDKLAHLVYSENPIGEDSGKIYTSDDVADEVVKRCPKFTGDRYSLPVDTVVIPLFNGAGEEIEDLLYETIHGSCALCRTGKRIYSNPYCNDCDMISTPVKRF